jgi:ATP-dependent helicase/nuclease subunit B
MLETVNVVLSPNSNAATISELFRFYTSACSASDSLTVLCSTQDLGGASLKPSLAFTRLQALFPSSRLIDTSKLSYDQRIENKKASFEIMKQFSETEEREALSRLFRNDPDYAHYLDTDRQPLITSEEKLDSEALSALFTGDLSLTQSRLDSYVLCAFGYECTYALKLKETKRAEFKASDTGNLVHRILEKFFYTATNGHESVPPMTDKEIDTLLDSIFDEYLFTIFGKTHDERYSGRIGQLFFRLRRLVRVLIRNLLDEFAQSEFVPTFFEMPISSSGVEGSVAPLAIPLPDGTHAYIYGIADRVDICRRGNDVYVRVVDYKTGQKDFSLYDISLGLNLQMLLYLFSIWKDETGSFRRAVSCSGDIIPSGVLYCTAKPSEITVAGDLTDEQIYAKVEDTLKRKGLLLNDEEVLRMMEKKLDGKYIPVTLKKDGSLSTSLTLESLEGLGKLMDDIMTTISRLAGEMKSGVATCRPLKDAKHDACRFCPHKPVCRNPSALS